MENLNCLTFDLVGLKVKFLVPDSFCQLIPTARFQNFLSTDPAEVIFEIHYKEKPSPYFVSTSFIAENWALSLLGQQIGFQINTFSRPSPQPIQAVLLNPEGHTGEIWVVKDLVRNGQLPVPPVLLDELMGVYLSARGWGVILHACGIKTSSNQGLVFSGVSGAGKSTMGRIWLNAPENILLSDERVAIRKKDGHFWVFGTPWNSNGRSSEPGCAPLKHLFIIRHSPMNLIRHLEVNEALSLLMPQVFLPYGDSAGLAFTLDFLGELVQTIPCFELGFVPDGHIIDFVNNFA